MRTGLPDRLDGTEWRWPVSGTEVRRNRGTTAVGAGFRRIAVYDVLDDLASGMTTDQIVADFPELSEQHVRLAI
jgi:hypothetical protein